MTTPDAEKQNRAAWDALYRKTRDPVWGRQPVGFLPQVEEPVRQQLPPTPCLLDAGTGEGRNLPALLAWSSRVWACDASPHALAKIPGSLRRQVKLREASLQSLPFGDGGFDLALLCDTVETLPDPAPPLREIRRVLASGGVLLCNIPDASDAVAGVDMTPAEGGGFWYRERYYFRFYSREEAIALAQETGFEVAQEWVCHWSEPPHPAFRGERHEHTSRVFLWRVPDGAEQESPES